MKKPAAPKPTKLSIPVRNSVAMSLFNAACEADTKHLKEMERELFPAVLVDVFGQNWEAAFKAIPEGWLQKSNYIVVHHSDRSGNTWFYATENYPLPWSALHGQGIKTSPEMEARVIDYNNKRTAHSSKFSRDRRLGSHPPFLLEIKQTLAAIGTVEALKEQWPEAYEFLPKDVPDPPSNHPVPAPIYADVIALYRTFVKENADVASV